jgi:hypothetical protein
VRRRLLGVFACAIACRPADEPTMAAPAAEPSAPGPARESAPREPVPAPGPGAPSLVVKNHEATAIDIYGAYLVDRHGKLGTRSLWPHPSDCPDVVPPPHLVPGAGVLYLPPPSEAYVQGSCTPEPLPTGDYVLRLSSGYGEELYAGAAITVPLSGPVELEMKRHEDVPACSPERARRAAVLALDAAEADGKLPPEFRRECDLERATCGRLPLEEALPPETCTITLHERLLRVERAASDDAPRWLEAWADHEVVYVQQPDVTRTSASRVEIDGKQVVLAGLSSRERHEHGGDAAKIGHATFVAHNPHARPLRMRVRGIEFLRDFQCNLPTEVRARPAVTPGNPTELPPGRSEITIGFTPQAAYQAHCDRFATRVTLEVEGRRIRATTEHEVMRFEPLRGH